MSKPLFALELIAVVLGLGLFFAGGFYWLDYRNAGLHQAGAPVWRPEIAFDSWIPLSPIWIWPYLAWYPFCFLPLVFAGRLATLRRITLAYSLAYGPCLVFFALVPTGIERTAFDVTGPSTYALDLLYRVDPGFNVFPSLHVATAVLVGLIFRRMGSKWSGLVWIFAGLISFSTVLTKQHYLIDVPAGVLLGWVAFTLSFGIGSRRSNRYGNGPPERIRS